jgi:hypothetical protein
VSSTMPKSSCGVFQEAGVKTRWQQVTPTTCRGWMDGIKDLPLPVALGQSLGRRESNFSSSSSSTCVRARCELPHMARGIAESGNEISRHTIQQNCPIDI